MTKTFSAALLLAVFAGCSAPKPYEGRRDDIDSRRGEVAIAKPPQFALPGVPLQSELEDQLPAAPAELKELAAPAEPPAEPKPAVTAADTGGELDFHMAAAGKYAARRRYRSAAAEYGAAFGLLPAGDARAVHLLERQGAMMLRAGDAAKAREHFLAAIDKAKELNTSGDDLAGSHLGLGYCLEKAGNIPAAIENYETALKLSSSKTIKSRISKTISDLKKTP